MEMQVVVRGMRGRAYVWRAYSHDFNQTTKIDSNATLNDMHSISEVA